MFDWEDAGFVVGYSLSFIQLAYNTNFIVLSS
jgi:hypothetical protein